MRKSASRGLRVAAGTAIGAIGLGIVALASSGSALAAGNPAGVTGQLGITTGNPINVSATIPAAITVDITSNSSGISFGTIQPGTSAAGTTSLNDTVTSNDPAGYATALFGTNNGTAWLNGNPSASCPESIATVAPGTSGPTAPVSTVPVTSYAPSGGVTRPISTWSAANILASGALDPAGAGGDLYYVANGTPGGTVGSNSTVAVHVGGNASAVTASAAAFNQGMTSVGCNFSFNPSTGVGTDTFTLADLPWGALSATNAGGQTAAFTENNSEGTYTDASQPTPVTLVTNPLTLDSKSTVSGTAGSLTATTDSYTDTLKLTVPGNQAAGSYQAALDLLIWGN